MKHPTWTYPLRYLTAGMCAWETWAVLMDDDRYPTFSRIAGEHRWFAPVLMACLAIHLMWPLDTKAPLEDVT